MKNARNWQRLLIGTLAVVLLTSGITGEFFLSPDSAWHTALAPGLRAGILLAVVWLALPDIDKLPAWAGLAILASVGGVWFLAGKFKFLLPLGLGAILMLLFLRPRRRSVRGTRR